MVKLNMSNNRIRGAEAGKALGDALAANMVLKELNLSENYSGPEFAKEFAVGLGTNGALASGHQVTIHGMKETPINGKLATIVRKLSHLDSFELQGVEAYMVRLECSGQARFMFRPHLHAKGTLETITFGDKQAVTMKANMTEADISGKELGASGVIIAAAFLPKCQ